MRYNVAQLMKGPTGDIRRYQLQEEINNLDESITPLSTLDGEVQLMRTMDGLLVTGDLHTSLQLECSRCLDIFSKVVRISLEEEFLPTIDVITGAHLSVDAEADEANLIDDRHQLDLTEVVRQDLLVAIPVAPLCRTGCKGLCPICGKNWNHEECHHDNDDIDPRFAKLKELLDNQN